MAMTSAPGLPILPVALLLAGRPCLVVGAGKVAARKAGHLIEAGARVTVVGEHASAAVCGLHASGAIRLEERAFAEQDMTGCALVFAATDDADANLRVLEACRRQGILCGCVDFHWREGDLISPAVLRTDDLTVAVSTGGRSCRRARLVRDRLARHLAGVDTADLLVIGTGMTSVSTTFTVGTRTSNLARAQTRQVVERLRGLLPGWTFDVHPRSSPGDRDRAMDLRESPADFFTRDLDEAVLRGDLDFAVHSAKDMPNPITPGLDWFWLPWRDDPRDCLVLPAGRSHTAMPLRPRLGVSSERREAYCRCRFPDAQFLPIRGNIEDRLAQLDGGRFDALVMAGAALNRLGLETRISEWIPLEELPTPPGQGALGLAFRAGDARLIRLRSLFVRPVAFVGAGVGSAGMCTVDGLAELEACDVCIHDALIDPALLAGLRVHAQCIDAGKRAGDPAHAQAETTDRILDYARQGRRVVRLKGGDPGIFGRLAEETEALEALDLAFRVVPGVSSLNAATTGTGMLLTRRGVSQGFCAITARAAGGKPADVSASARSRLPVVFFMAGQSIASATAQLLSDGWAAATPAAVILAAGTDDEAVVSGTLTDLTSRMDVLDEDASNHPALLICGDAAGYRFRGGGGALRGQRVLLTFSEALLKHAAQQVRDWGGVPVSRPMVCLSPRLDERGWLRDLRQYDWSVVTSPSAVDCLMKTLRQTMTDLRSLPRLLVAGPGTAARFEAYGIQADAQPAADFGCAGVLEWVRRHLTTGERVLRLRSDRAGAGLAHALRGCGLRVDDVVLYRNEPMVYARKPRFDMAVFASGAAVESLLAQWGREALTGKRVAAFPGSACAALAKAGIPVDVVAAEPTVAACVGDLALHDVRRAMEEETETPPGP
ncbi:MAG: hydroxymethylbilane synthase [Lentisphaerae bacterium]|nr:hydroxymethylbilane synthase [Lentisphaerota bacterium]